MKFVKGLITKWLNNKNNIDSYYNTYKVFVKRENIDMSIDDILNIVNNYKPSKEELESALLHKNGYVDNDKVLYDLLSKRSDSCELIYGVYFNDINTKDIIKYYLVFNEFMNSIYNYTFYIKEENKKQLENIINNFRIGFYHISKSIYEGFGDLSQYDCVIIKIDTRYNYNPKNMIRLNKFSSVMKFMVGESKYGRIC